MGICMPISKICTVWYTYCIFFFLLVQHFFKIYPCTPRLDYSSLLILTTLRLQYNIIYMYMYNVLLLMYI